MIRAIRQAIARRKLAADRAKRRDSHECERFRRRRKAALRHQPRVTVLGQS